MPTNYDTPHISTADRNTIAEIIDGDLGTIAEALQLLAGLVAKNAADATAAQDLSSQIRAVAVRVREQAKRESGTLMEILAYEDDERNVYTWRERCDD